MARHQPLPDPFVAEPGPAPGPEPDALTALGLSPSADAAARAWAFMPAEAPEAPPALTGAVLPAPTPQYRSDAEATLACLAALTLRSEALAAEVAALREQQAAHGARLARLEAKAAASTGARPGGPSTGDVAPVMGEPQAEHDCAVADAAGKVHGPCRLNRFGHCPKCYTTAVYHKSRA